jgi:hypothetical protein
MGLEVYLKFIIFEHDTLVKCCSIEPSIAAKPIAYPRSPESNRPFYTAFANHARY